ncbi:MFS transporter [Rhodococcus sp. C3V]|uniref:MFS transporter n=1 Tax=Rhodococcus sp. C3V TaxID=3034165 RepID=UPI0023E0BCC4|nr:MFS transporter [Rhodococcus sp. C3V]MDF3319934.1 MFS transporter [Rhodococcus sp. C3V]
MDTQSQALVGQASPGARLDRLPVTRRHVFWVVVLGLGYLVEMFDNVVFSFLAPTIRAEWGLSIGQVGLVTSAVFIGMTFGAIGGGRLSDRFGRKPVLLGASVFYSLTSLMSALAPNFEVLFLSRVLTGIGVQAAAGVIFVYISEMFPTRTRGRFLAVTIFIGGISNPLTSFAALAIAPSGEGAWRWVFAFGVVGFVIAGIAAVGLPESVRWLTANGKTEEAQQIAVKMETIARSQGELGSVATEPEGTHSGTYRDLLSPPYRRRMVLLGSAFAVFIFGLYGFSSWVPTVLVDRGMDQSEALKVASIASFGVVLAPLLLFAVSDKIERKTAVLAAVLVAGVGMIVFGQTSTTLVLTVVAVIVQCALVAATTSFYTYIPEVFPTHIRGAGAGVVGGVARLGGIASGVVVAAMYSGLGSAALYLILGLLMFAVGVVVAVFGPRTTGRSLEEISRD